MNTTFRILENKKNKNQTCISKALLVLEEFALGTYGYTEGLVINIMNLKM